MAPFNLNQCFENVAEGNRTGRLALSIKKTLLGGVSFGFSWFNPALIHQWDMADNLKNHE